jgi:CDP-diglyceride synthetase
VDDVPDRREDDVTRTDLPVTRPESSGPATDRVRIVGAEPAGEATSVVPVVSREADPAGEVEPHPASPAGSADDEFSGEADDEFGQPKIRLTGEPGDPDGSAQAVNPVSPGQTAVPNSNPAPTELPHWTEPPTGQVPAVLSRDAGGEGSGSAIGAPSWREEDADWVAHDEEFEPAMFGDDEVALGSLDETDSSDADRRPWEFDLESASPGSAGSARQPVEADVDAGAQAATIAPITEPVEVVPPVPADHQGDHHESGGTPSETDLPSDAALASDRAGTVAAAGVGPGVASTPGDDRTHSGMTEPIPFATDEHPPDEELYETEKARPTGSARIGRARRNGLLPARMRAKRPDDVDVLTDSPLAAEPPGASVTDVPGAGRKRGGVAGLAAADRSAERDGDLQAADAASADVGPDRTRPASEGVDIVATAAVGPGVSRRRPKRWSSSDPSPTPDAVPGGDGSSGGGPPPPRRSRRSAAESGRSSRRSHDGGRSIGLRVGTGIAVAVIALLAFKLGTVPSLVLCMIVVTFAAGECFGVLRRAGYHPATLLGLVGTISLMVGAYSKGIAAVPLVLVLITAFTLVWYLFGIERGSPVAGTAATLLTVGWVSLLGAYAGLLLSPSMFPHRHGIAFLLGAIIATVANDVGALMVGGWMGRRPLAPSISPNKTWEGLVGGAMFTILASTVVVGAIHPWTPANAALLGVVVAVVAPIGDLCESLLKRDLRLKDMGTLLPGHGGVLDRVDALLFVLPATYYLVRALNIG